MGEQLHEDGGKMLVSCPERNCQHVDHRFGHQTKWVIRSKNGEASWPLSRMTSLSPASWHLLIGANLLGKSQIKWMYYFSVAKSHPTLCNPMDCSAPGSPILHYLSGFAQIGPCQPENRLLQVETGISEIPDEELALRKGWKTILHPPLFLPSSPVLFTSQSPSSPLCLTLHSLVHEFQRQSSSCPLDRQGNWVPSEFNPQSQLCPGKSENLAWEIECTTRPLFWFQLIAMFFFSILSWGVSEHQLLKLTSWCYLWPWPLVLNRVHKPEAQGWHSTQREISSQPADSHIIWIFCQWVKFGRFHINIWMSGFFLRARRWSSMGLPAHVSNLPKPRSSCPVGMELLFLKASQSPLLAVSHPAHSAHWAACLAEQGWGAATLLLMVPTVSFWKEQVLKIDSHPRCHWLVTFWASSASSRKWNLKLSAWICVMLGTFIFTINMYNVQFTISTVFNCIVQRH